MTSPTPPPHDIPSPCVAICIVGADGYCIGCFRSRAERESWWTATVAEKWAILARCEERERRHQGGGAG